MNLFNLLLKRKEYDGPVVMLKESYRVSEKEAFDGIATVYYNIISKELNKKVGSIDLRLTNNEEMYYFGNIGYTILESYRGHNYAYYASKMVMEIADKEFGMKELLITCSPENIASYKTLVKLGGEILELVDVPVNHYLYRIGEKKKYIFRYKLD